MRLQGKVAIITGSGSGIGRATALLFAEQGAKVAVVDINRDGGEATVSLIRDQGGEAFFILADVSREEDAERISRETVRRFGGVDILVNNAAIFVIKGLEATIEDWQRSLAVNVIGTALCSKYAVEEMKKRGKGAIVNLGSISSVIAQPEFITYSATKAAILQMTRNMAVDLAPFHIRVNCVCPGTILTPALQNPVEQQGISLQQLLAEEASKHVLGRVGEPREVAYAILFLASDEASFITGTYLMVDGGYTAR
ncbi:MAG: glucose 1-dehydrogenase [Acidobacteria bacterium]|nr:MAG: glucose 1-dehydrogenase [Acidobacteriota bacterium]